MDWSCVLGLKVKTKRDSLPEAAPPGRRGDTSMGTCHNVPESRCTTWSFWWSPGRAWPNTRRPCKKERKYFTIFICFKMQYFSSLIELTCSMVIFALVSAEFNSTVSEVLKVLRLQQWNYSTYQSKMDDYSKGFLYRRFQCFKEVLPAENFRSHFELDLLSASA